MSNEIAKMWVVQQDTQGFPDYTKKFSIDEPTHIPRQGEYIDSSEVGGYVVHVQYNYSDEARAIVYVYVQENGE